MKPLITFPHGWRRTAWYLLLIYLIWSVTGLVLYVMRDAPWQQLAAVGMLVLLIVLIKERQ